MKLLVTSREVLHLRAEYQVVVPPLLVPVFPPDTARQPLDPAARPKTPRCSSSYTGSGSRSRTSRPLQTPLSPAEREAIEQVVTTARAALDLPAFEREWNRGTMLTLEEAMEEVVAD